MFDLERGRITLGAERHVLVPASALRAVCHVAGPGASRDLGRALGEAIGRRLAGDATPPHGMAFDAAIDALGAEVAWLGLGSLSAERWGDLLVLRLEGAPPGPAEDDPLLAGLVEAALAAWTGRAAHAVVAERSSERVRVLIGGSRIAGVAQALVDAGAGLAEIVRRLHTGSGDAPREPA